MSLPLIDVPLYDLVIPSTKQKIKFRPYLVKEQKILLMANTGDNIEETLESIKQVIKNCTFDKVNIDVLPLFDIEYIFLQLRAKSVGEIVEPIIECKGCRNNIHLSVNLSEIQVQFPSTSNKIEMNSKVGIVFNYPTVEIEKKIEANKDNISQNYQLLYECIDNVYDENQVYTKKDFSYEEFVEFVENLNSDQFEKILDFFSNQPVISKTISYNCPKCQLQANIELKGLLDFLA